MIHRRTLIGSETDFGEDISAIRCLLFRVTTNGYVDVGIVFLQCGRSIYEDMVGGRKRQRRKHNPVANGAIKRRAPKRNESATGLSRDAVKDFEIFVTDFLTDPCGLPLELKDHDLVDGTISSADTPG